MYLVESSKGNTRGRLVSLYTLLLTCGNVLACGISMGTSKLSGANTWRELPKTPIGQVISH